MLRIGNFRIHLVFLFLGQILDAEALYVALKMPRFVEKGHSAVLKCDFTIDLNELYKVEWRRYGKKVFQFIKGRRPPFRNFSMPGGTVDWSNSNERQVTLKDLDFSASGPFTCTIAMEKPIYSRDSAPVYLTVFERQKDDPQIVVRKAPYSVGEVLELNCTSEPANPTPAVSWLLNGKAVEYTLVKTFTHGQHQKDKHLSSATTQLTLEVLEKHIGPSGFIELTCLSTIPAYLDDDDETFADKREQTVSIEVYPLPTTTEEEEPISKSSSINVPFFIGQILRLASPALCRLLLG